MLFLKAISFVTKGVLILVHLRNIVLRNIVTSEADPLKGPSKERIR